MARLNQVASLVVEHNENLKRVELVLPEGFILKNPFAGVDGQQASASSVTFYERFYSDTKPRRLIIGSSPARRGTALTGVPFVSPALIGDSKENERSAYRVNVGAEKFLDDVICQYGGAGKFFGDFLMGFAFPLGITRINARGREVNVNYYENKLLLERVRETITWNLRQYAKIAADTSVCYCIGSGENFTLISQINAKENLFGRIEPLAHPRYIAQYNPSKTHEFLDHYLAVLRDR